MCPSELFLGWTDPIGRLVVQIPGFDRMIPNLGCWDLNLFGQAVNLHWLPIRARFHRVRVDPGRSDPDRDDSSDHHSDLPGFAESGASQAEAGAYGVGATRWSAILNIILPAAISGITGGVMLALGRAMGETMAVTMIIGNSNNFSFSLLAPGNTIAAMLASRLVKPTAFRCL